MKKYLRPSLLLLFVLFSIHFVSQNNMRQSREFSVFDETCNAPCWRHITPGITGREEAYDLISNFHDRETGDIIKWEDYGPFNAYYVFDLSNGLTVGIYTINDVVAMIGFYDEQEITTFGKCVAKFGTPELVGQSYILGRGAIPFGDASYILFTALLPQQGITYGFSTPFGSKNFVSEDSKVDTIEYFDIAFYETLAQQGLLVSSYPTYDESNLHLWTGYGNIFELYPYDE